MNTVIGAVDTGKHVFFRDHGGMNPCLDMFSVVPADRKQLDPVSKLSGKGDVNRFYP